ncbi:hypothetical protein H0264_35615 [Nocardia huaxiensis]|uniref:Uncharacterized protein n=1 Tax=Nocardia huaxiensis TaxID=2755382 RepID=A0A7D6VA01_9NOCA|nr:hypothetical protein [Nocardia huaxiensis]QLY30394.1 hypothetical protein H0264_35615 [Nocardia huaxiensis]
MSTTKIQLADELQPTVPETDYVDVASEIANYVVTNMLRFSDRLHAFLNERYDAAPTSAEHAMDFDAVIAQEVLNWVRNWPK